MPYSLIATLIAASASGASTVPIRSPRLGDETDTPGAQLLLRLALPLSGRGGSLCMPELLRSGE
jgi:hypothetical protein